MPASGTSAMPMNGRAAASWPRRAITVGGGGALQGEQGAVLVQVELHAGGEVGGDVGEVGVLAAGVDHQEQALAAEVGDHQVVDDAAGLVGQQGVALAAGLQAEHVAGDQAFECGRSRGAGQRGLAHVGDVEQGGLGAAVEVLGQHALVLDGHGVAGELHHAGAVGAMPRVERGGLQRLGRGVVRQRILDHWFAPQRSPAGNRCRYCDPPLSRNLKD